LGIQGKTEVLSTNILPFFLTEVFTFLIVVFTIIGFGEAEIGSAEEQPVEE